MPEVRRGAWTHAIRVGLPLVAACLLAALAIALLVREARKAGRLQGELATTEGEYSTTPIPLEAYPRGSPNDPNPEPLQRYEGEYPRWNIRDFPKGWDPALAKTIHAYFEAMSVDDLSDEGAIDRLREAREGLADFLAGLGGDAVPTLGAILNAEGDFVNRRFILKALGNLGASSEQATFVLRDFFVARYLDRRNDSEMWHVIDAMQNLKNATSFDVLTDFIASPQEDLDLHRPHFVEALGEHPRRNEAIGTFIDHMHRDREPYQPTRNKAAQALGKIRDPSTLTELYRAAEQESWYPAKQTMLGSIGKIGSPDSVPFLEKEYREALAEPSGPEGSITRHGFDIRLSAARALSRIATPEALQTLRGFTEIETNEKVRGYMEKWIAEAETSAGR